MAAVSALEAAKAVNSLLHLSSGDQQSLLAVIEDYFTGPSVSSSLVDSEDDDFEDDMSNDGIAGK